MIPAPAAAPLTSLADWEVRIVVEACLFKLVHVLLTEEPKLWKEGELRISPNFPLRLTLADPNTSPVFCPATDKTSPVFCPAVFSVDDVLTNASDSEMVFNVTLISDLISSSCVMPNFRLRSFCRLNLACNTL